MRILQFGWAGNLFVKDTIVRDNGFVGIWLQPGSGTTAASIDHCRLDGNRYGLISDHGADTTIRDSVASGGAAVGLFGQGSGQLNIEKCVAAYNNIGVAGSDAGSHVRYRIRL